MPPKDDAATRGPLAEFDVRSKTFAARMEALEGKEKSLGLSRLLTFLAVVVLVIAGVRGPSPWLLAGGGACALAFLVLVFVHARIVDARRDAELRREVYLRHIDRLVGTWVDFSDDGSRRLEKGHPYAKDIDLVGKGSLVQRIDVSHTERGGRTLVAWLSAPAPKETIDERQAAVAEMVGADALRESLEVAALSAHGKGRLTAEPFEAFVKREPFLRSPLWVALIHLCPLAVLGLGVAAFFDTVPDAAFLGALTAQTALALLTSRRCHEAFDLISARRGYVEAFRRMLMLIEKGRFEAPLLVRLREKVVVGGEGPTKYLKELDRWAGMSELRTQFPVYIIVNLLLLWDLHVLLRLERWNARIGKEVPEVLGAVAELEALASLATLGVLEPNAVFPEVVQAGGGFEAEGLGHPLIPQHRRVSNDLRIEGPGHALIVTGSNMAGKSTLLRAVGLSTALALAGGMVVARRLALPIVRLRASMRIDDDLQEGASYFHAELTKLKSVVADAEGDPPLLFLMDELLRGTNARARTLGSRAVIEHLLDRGAMGLTATHDIGLTSLEESRPGKVRNVHFTDVMDGEEMLFDYRLREGVVRTSNALRLLSRAGISVPSPSTSTTESDG